MPETETAVKEATQETEAAALADPTVAAATEVSPSDTTAAGGAEATVTEPGPSHPWSGIPDPYDVLDLPDLQDALSHRDERTRAETQAAERERFTQERTDWEATQVYNTLAGHYGSIKDKLGEGDLIGAEKILSKVEKLAERYDGAFEKAVRSNQQVKASVATRELLMVGLSGRARAELRTFMETKAETWEQALKERDKLLRPSIREEVERDVRAQVEEEARAKAREVKGNPPVPAGGGGGGGSGYRTKTEARTLHVQNKISHSEMRRINSDPSIPEM
jgi:hypothetical protein